ncbi:MAG: hypothetical protein ACI9XB_000981 [Gammaproteobacteria bacterium]|jgi:hypothetical protein
MNKKIIWLLIFITNLSIVKSQSNNYDTIVISSSTYEKFDFILGSSEMQYFEVIERDIDIRNGEIEKSKLSSDTIGIKNTSRNMEIENYEIELSDYNWAKILFGRQCNYLSKQIDTYPILKVSRRKSNNDISFLEPELIGRFLTNNYEKRIECIDSSEDKLMKKHLIRWIDMIGNDSIDQFAISLTSHLYHIFSLYDLIVPTNNQDTLLCKITQLDKENPIGFVYQSSTKIKQDSSINIYITDDVQDSTSLNINFTSSIYQMFEKHLSKEERTINEIRLKSRKSVDKSHVKISKTGEFVRYIRIMESFMLDAELKPKFSFFNYEIKIMK